MDLSKRKLIELDQKLDSLKREFDYWRDQSENYKPLQKHHTQIRRITSQLEGMQEAIRKEIVLLREGASADVLSEARDLERDILEVHRIWEFFRGKLALRSVDWFNPYLVAADEFAWVCYQCARGRFNYEKLSQNALKEPPLVFFNGGSSPYTLPRNLTYQAEQVPGEGLKSIQSSEVLKELPIPVIGIPWFQIQHLPDMLVIGHEVGHDVEEDFQLSDRILGLLETGMEAAKTDAARRPAWRSWLRETFADLYGVLAGGPAFVASLMDFLASDKELTETDRRQAPRWGSYPPDYLRLLINIAALRELGFKDEAKNIETALKNTYDKHAMQDYEEDIPVVVKALLNEPYAEFKGDALKQVIIFTSSNQKSALADSERLLNGISPTADDMRVLLAAAWFAYSENPGKYKSADAHSLVLKRVPAIQQTGVRGTRYGEEVKVVEPSELDEYDKTAGGQLFERLRKRKRDN